MSRYQHRLTLLDGVLVIASLCIILASGWQLWFQSGFGRDELEASDMIAEIRVRGQLAHSLALDQNKTLTVSGPQGDTVIEVDDGAVRFVSSPCPHKHCLRAGWLRRSSAVAFCLPNHIGLQLINAQTQYDSINF